MGWGLERGSCGWHGDKNIAQSMHQLCTNPPSTLSSLLAFPLSWQCSLKPTECQMGLLSILHSGEHTPASGPCLSRPSASPSSESRPSTYFRSFFSRLSVRPPMPPSLKWQQQFPPSFSQHLLLLNTYLTYRSHSLSVSSHKI